ncbi:hypothetical protein [Actinoplanes sp. NPDC048796]|uniref:hypothetical protein n=1 Tax=unclassified Actinoplanes TaxID=2626549 RepID=UPI0033C5744C
MPAGEVIAAALAAGATAGMKDTASAAVKDAYSGLKRVLRPWLRGDARQALEADETEPDVWEALIGDELDASGAVEDEEVLTVARRLLALVDPDGSAAGKFLVDAREAKGVQVGDHNTQHNTFS